jgi:uncharacterized membrane protein YidH (DUF202 family)
LEVSRERHSYTHLGKPVGATFIALGVSFLVIGVFRYFTVQSRLTENKFPVARRSVLFAGMSVGAIVIAAFAVIIATPVSGR